MRILFSLLASTLLFSCTPKTDASKTGKATSRDAYIEQRDELVEESYQGEKVSEQAASRFRDMRDSLLLTYRREKRFPLKAGFYSARKEIASTPIFKALHAMPKGGLLHSHDLAFGSAWLLVDMAISMPDCYVYWGEENERFLKGQLGFYKVGEAPGGFMQTSELNTLSLRFREELYDLLSFDIQDVSQSKDIWVPFEQQFQKRLGFMHYQPAMVPYFVAAFDSLVQSGVQHLELRSILSDALYDLEHPKDYYPIDSMVAGYKQALAITQKKYPHFTLKLIHTGFRFLPAKLVQADFAKGFALKQRHPNMVVGYDLVGQEDNGLPTLKHLDCCWLKRDSLEEAYGVKLPLYLHDGESNWPGNDNLLDAVLLDVKRIGHGLNLFRYPQVEAKVKSQGICIEISPISNQILGYTPDIRNHPAAGYFRRGVPISLNNDDPSIFAYYGITYDFWVAAVAWGFDLGEIKRLARNSLEYSALEGDEKRQAIAKWEADWEAWELIIEN